MNNYFKQKLTIVSKSSLIIGNLSMSVIIFFYIAFLHDLSQLSAGVSLWNGTVLEVLVMAIISLIGIILGFITKRNHMKKICVFTLVGYLLSIASASSYYYNKFYLHFPMQILVAFICILPFIASFSYTKES